MVEPKAIREAVLTTIQKQLSNSIIEGDSHIAIQSTTDKIKAKSQIPNLISDIIALAKAIKNINFIYYNRSSNRLANKIAKKGY